MSANSNFVIFDPFANQAVKNNESSEGVFRGGGRILQILHENFDTEPGVRFVNSLDHVKASDTLLLPIWDPFQPPLLKKHIAQKQILMIFDVIPLKFPHHFPTGLKGKIHLWQNKQAFKFFDLFLTISQHAQKDISTFLNIPSEKIKVVYPTYARTFSPQLDISNNHDSDRKISKDVVLYVGDINWNKNITTLAKALKIAQMRGIFVGKAFKNNHEDINNPWLREFKHFRAEMPGSRITCAGHVPDDELKKLYKSALCNILISRDEGFGMSYLEAATQGCPSILSDIPIFHEIALSTARYVSPDDPHEIAQALFELQNSPEICRKIADEAFIRSQAFAPEEFKKQLLGVI